MALPVNGQAVMLRPKNWRRVAKRIASNVRYTIRPIRDAWSNWRHDIHGERFLVIRHRQGLPNYYQGFLEWTATEFPNIRRLFELRLLPEYLRDWSPYRLAIPWLPGTLLYGNTVARACALQFAVDCDLRRTPIINRPESLLGMSKFDTAESLRRIGIRTPRMRRLHERVGFEETAETLGLPFLIRDDLARRGRLPTMWIENRRQWHDMPWHNLSHPVAVEFINVRDANDGLYRKHRYIAVGEAGIAHTLQISQHWEVRGAMRILHRGTRREEIAYTEKCDPNHLLMQHARRTLGLDICGFDYSYTSAGELVVWKTNVMPELALPNQTNRAHLRGPVERTMAATLRLYLERAGFEVPDRIQHWAPAT